ncbi:hypothetical protein FB45DRAFT_1000428 [Roridomyces roridus]|uniref:Uncharacterized protein n=1 Tax=Roridomyces roridus TaxID=1738132 RepID=A0AAD7C8X5_9AGAR|nr:hypothetical protein FB45DRAFT_1000428 [Roridomyces roridus]
MDAIDTTPSQCSAEDKESTSNVEGPELHVADGVFPDGGLRAWMIWGHRLPPATSSNGLLGIRVFQTNAFSVLCFAAIVQYLGLFTMSFTAGLGRFASGALAEHRFQWLNPPAAQKFTAGSTGRRVGSRVTGHPPTRRPAGRPVPVIAGTGTGRRANTRERPVTITSEYPSAFW